MSFHWSDATIAATRLPRRAAKRYTTFYLILVAALAVLLCSVGRPALAQDGDEPITATDLLNIRQLGDVKLSPDGRQVLYTVRSIETVAPVEGSPENAQPEYAYRSHLYIADPLRPSENRPLTRGELSAGDAAWHPDGDRIAFVRAVDDVPQIFILPLLGGEAYPVTDVPSGASSPRWSPSGDRLLFSSRLSEEEIRQRTGERATWPLERPGRRAGDSDDIRPDPNGSVPEIRAWLDANAADGRPRVFHRLNFHGETDLEDAPKYRHWFVTRPGSTEREPVLITRGTFDFAGGEWMPDGTRVLVSGNMRGDVHPDRIWDTELYSAAADGSGMQPFFDLDGHSVGSPVVSPDGNAVAFVARRIDQAGYAQNELGILPLNDAGEARLLTLGFDRSTSAPTWSADGWHLYFTAASEGGFPLYRVPAFPQTEDRDVDSVRADTALAAADTTSIALDISPPASDSLDVRPVDSVEAVPNDTTLASDNPRVERLTGFERGIRSFDVGSASVFYVATEVANPYELYVSNSPFTADRRITSHNADWLESKRISLPEARVLVRDGMEIPYWIMRPTFFDSTKNYPMLLQIHGGPSAMWGPGEASMWHEFQFFASRGYGIVFSNPRGSGGYGYEFKRANYQNWGEGPAGDVLAVAAAAADEPWLDEERQVVTGGSYAGYLTAWIVGHDHRFQAAVAQRGVYDLGTFLGEGNAWRLVPTHFGGYPWDRSIDSTAIAADTADAAEAADARRGIASTAGALPDSADAAGTLPDSAASDTLASLAADTADSLRNDAVGAPAESILQSGEVIEARDSESVADILIRNSPLTYVHEIRTPLLIIHGDQDLRTGVIQSEILYKSLKILDRPVEYVRYPESGHELSRSGNPRLRIDRILRIYEFMERFIR